MMQARWVREIGVAGALALAALVIGAPGSAQAQSTDDSVEANSIWNLDKRIWGTFTRGLGLRTTGDPVIDYRERSPLVVPPSRDLPPPQARATPRNPAWPADPDVARAKKANEAKRKLGAGNASSAIESRGDPLPPDQLNVPGAVRQSDRPAPAHGDPEGAPVAPSELGYFGGLFTGRAWGFGGYANETGTFTSEPPRTQLTEPPPGYQTPSAAHPYGTTRRVERSKVEAQDPGRR